MRGRLACAARVLPNVRVPGAVALRELIGGNEMIGFGHIRAAFLVFAALAALAVAGVAAGDHGSGGGGGGGAPPPASAAPAVTFAPTSLTFAAQAIGT